MRKSQSPRLHLGASLSASASENPIHVNQLGGGGGGGGDWRAPSDHYSPQEKATGVGPREREREREPDQHERREEAGTRETEQGSHSPRDCSNCFALHECTRDNAFNARVNMLISPSHADAQAHSASTAASRAREETPVGGERQVSVLLDTGASGRNFISSKLASWLIEERSHYAQ